MKSERYTKWTQPDRLALIGTIVGVLTLLLYIGQITFGVELNKSPSFYFLKDSGGGHCPVLPIVTAWNDNTFELDLWIEGDMASNEHEIARMKGTWEKVIGRYLFTFKESGPYMDGDVKIFSDDAGRALSFQMDVDDEDIELWNCQLTKKKHMSRELSKIYEKLSG